MTLYLDTSVLSALFDTENPERLEITKEFYASRTSDRLLVSKLTLAEIAATPKGELREAVQKAADGLEAVEITVDADRLASLYVQAGAVAAVHRRTDAHSGTASQRRSHTPVYTLGERVEGWRPASPCGPGRTGRADACAKRRAVA